MDEKDKGSNNVSIAGLERKVDKTDFLSQLDKKASKIDN